MKRYEAKKTPVWSKNEVKFQGKIHVDIEYGNNKQEMEILITERNDITPLLGMDWLEKF